MAAKARGRYGVRDATAIMMAARHGFRATELCALRWDQVDFAGGWLHVVRRKKGDPSTHPLECPAPAHRKTNGQKLITRRLNDSGQG
jgi:integrase